VTHFIELVSTGQVSNPGVGNTEEFKGEVGNFSAPSETGVNVMANEKNRERVTAEITLFHLILLANEHGCKVSHEQAMAFLNEKETAQEIWKQMMQAGLDFIQSSLLPASPGPSSLREVPRWTAPTLSSPNLKKSDLKRRQRVGLTDPSTLKPKAGQLTEQTR
jgi:hypothetical protein